MNEVIRDDVRRISTYVSLWNKSTFQIENMTGSQNKTDII